MSKRNLRGFNFERLENRRLLAADFGVEVIDSASMPAETCMAATLQVEDGVVETVEAEPEFEEPGECGIEMEIENVEAGDELSAEPVAETQPASEQDEATEDECDCDSEGDTDVIDSETEGEVDAVAGEQEQVAAELRDPVTGTAGYFGELDSISPSKSMTFSPSESGTIDVVVASSFGDAETHVEITNSEGELIARSMTEDLEGFQRLTFDVDGEETYEVTISSDESGEGYFMVTVDFEAVTDPGPVDLHSNEIGDSATQLAVAEGAIAVESELETAEDCDAFRFVAESEGQMVLDMTAASDGQKSNAMVSVFNPAGDLIVSGTTNEEVAIRFDTNPGVEYQVLVDSLNDVPTNFALSGTLFADAVQDIEPVEETLAGAETNLENELGNELGEELADCDAEMEFDENALVDEVFQELGQNIQAELDVARNRFGSFGDRWFGQM